MWGRPEIKIDWTFITAFAAGAVAGAVTALLYAPSEGAVLRANLSEKASGSVEAATKKVESIYSAYGRRYQAAQFQVGRLFTAVTAGVEEGRRVREEAQKALSGKAKTDG